MICKKCDQEVMFITMDGICSQCLLFLSNQVMVDYQAKRIELLESFVQEFILLFKPWADMGYVPPTNDIIDFIDKAKLLLDKNEKETD